MFVFPAQAGIYTLHIWKKGNECLIQLNLSLPAFAGKTKWKARLLQWPPGILMTSWWRRFQRPEWMIGTCHLTH